ncbi:MAG: hypothetical protein QM811_11045 [Pirellulales bacterium]
MGDLEPAPSDLNTANGKPATKSYSRDRLAHTLCSDRESFDDKRRSRWPKRSIAYISPASARPGAKSPAASISRCKR